MSGEQFPRCDDPHPLPDRGAPEESGVPDEGYDLLFVGGGCSTAYTLLSVLAALAEQPATSALRICVVERATDTFSGLPYGQRATKASLLLTSLREFLPDAERASFVEWLEANKDRVFAELRAEAGPLTARWCARHGAEIDRDEFDELFLPRYVFGTYLAERTCTAVDEARAAGIAGTDTLNDEVLSIDTSGNSYVVVCRERTVRARRVVLAVGSPPTAPRLGGIQGRPRAALLDGPFEDMNATEELIRTALRQADGRAAPHIVLIGANASTMDMLYLINDLGIPEVRTATFSVLSLRGQLPGRMAPPSGAGSFVPENLRRLVGAESVTAECIYRAALGDLARGRALALTATDTFQPIWDAVNRVLPRLSAAEAVEFAEHWGVELGRHQRRAGREYMDVADRLTAEQRLQLVAGRFADLVVDDRQQVHVRYEHDGAVHTMAPPADVVINCGGFVRDLRRSGPSLVTSLLAGGICRPTPSGVGILVDDSLQASPGFYVMGPLLAGNVLDGRPVWHMEHCGRISLAGSALGRRLARRLVREVSRTRPSPVVPLGAGRVAELRAAHSEFGVLGPEAAVGLGDDEDEPPRSYAWGG